MNTCRIFATIVLVTMAIHSSAAQQKLRLGDNAALRYWSAFAQMQDAAISNPQAKELNAILEGTVPYDDLKYRALVEANQPALETMARATALPACEWGIEYELRDDTPVDYVRKALTLGRLNVLYSFHLLLTGDKEKGVRTLASGLHFSRDVANGGTLFATVVAKTLLTSHLQAIAFALHTGTLSTVQRTVLQKAVADMGPHGLDWAAAMKREMSVLNRPDWQASVPLNRVTQAYVNALDTPSALPKLEQAIAALPLPLRDVIPNPKQVLEEKQELDEKLLQTRRALQ
jgi:hypothetical protein